MKKLDTEYIKELFYTLIHDNEVLPLYRIELLNYRKI